MALLGAHGLYTQIKADFLVVLCRSHVTLTPEAMDHCGNSGTPCALQACVPRFPPALPTVSSADQGQSHLPTQTHLPHLLSLQGMGRKGAGETGKELDEVVLKAEWWTSATPWPRQARRVHTRSPVKEE